MIYTCGIEITINTEMLVDSCDTSEGTEQLIERMKEFKSNKAFLESAEVK